MNINAGVMKKGTVTWPMLLAGLVLFFVAGIALGFLHSIFHDSIGIPLLLLWIVAVVGFWLTVLVIIIKLLKQVWQRV